MDTFYAVLNTANNEMVTRLSTDLEATKADAAAGNAAMKPEFATYTVATITLNPEV